MKKTNGILITIGKIRRNQTFYEVVLYER